jgi:hypothetical protein
VDAEREFSRQVWELNARFFAAAGGGLTVADAGEGFAGLAGSWFGADAGVGLGEFVGMMVEKFQG